MEYRSSGMMEDWNNGVMYLEHITPILQYSILITRLRVDQRHG